MNLLEAKYLSRAGHLIQDLEDGVISSDDREELMDLMRQHYSVRELYLNHIDMIALLKESAETRIDLGIMPVSEEILQTQRRKVAMVSFISGIAALLVIAVGLFAFQLRLPSAMEDTDIVMQSSDDAIFSVTDSDGKSNSDEKLEIGHKLSIGQGLIQLKLPNGVEALIEGPSELEIVSERAIKMDGGMAWFRVAESGHGFTVQTEKADIVDLGTEFGVRFDDSNDIQVHVAKGSVRVEPTVRTMPQIELRAGEAIIIDSNGAASQTESAVSLFRDKFTKSIPYLHWSFDELKNGAFAAKGTMNEASAYQAKVSSLRGVIEPSDLEKCQVQGRHGQAFAMDGSGLFADSMFPGIGGNIPRTVALWVRHRKIYSTRWVYTPYCVWGAREPGRLWKISFQVKPVVSLVTATMRSDEISGLKGFPHEGWVHIASVYTGKVTEKGLPKILHYVNGELQRTRPANFDPELSRAELDTDIESEKSKPLRIGASLEAKKGERTIDGDIDELFIIRGMINQEQVRRLMDSSRLDL